MAERKAKVIWTEQEEEKMYHAFVQVFKSDPKIPGTKAAKLAQVALDQHRRRDINSIMQVPAAIRNRLQAAGLINHLLGSAPVKPEQVDKNLLRINQLGEERDQAVAKALELEGVCRGQRQEIESLQKQLSNVPSEAQVLKTFVADIFWDLEQRKRALPGPTSADVNKAVEKVGPPTVVRRHNSEPTSEGRSRKVKVALIGGGYEYTHVQNEFRDAEGLDLRVFDTRSGSAPIGDRLKAFKDPAFGTVIVWANKTGHSDEASVKSQGIPYEIYRGERGGLIARIWQLTKEREEVKA